MKKTLLIAAAALAAGIISTQAQVYSQNVVGYVNQTVPGNSYQIIGSQMVNGSDANATNGDIDASLVNGLISSPAYPPTVSSNSVMFYWTGSGYANYYFYNAADATVMEGSTYPAGWYDGAGNPVSVHLASGAAAFIFNHCAASMTITTVGTVAQGTNVTSINPGYNLICLQEPISTNLVADANGNPLPYGLPIGMTSNPNYPPVQTHNDTLYFWTGSGFANYYYYNAGDATVMEGSTYPAGFYDGAGNPQTTFPTVNQGFFLYHNGSSIPWTNSFTVQ